MDDTIKLSDGESGANSSTSAISLFWIFLRLGLISFGGPIAHLGYFRDEFVTRRKWLSESAYADLVVLCQFLPGPASSQVGMALGLTRGGLTGSVAAWLGFTLPSAVALVLFALGMARFGETLGTGWLHGLKVVAVAVVAQALLAMGKSLCPDRLRASFAMIAATVILVVPSAWVQVLVILCGGIFGRILLYPSPAASSTHVPIPLSRIAGASAIILFFFLLVLLPMLAQYFPIPALRQFDIFYRAGSLVFGGGHVVLPLLQADLVPQAWISNDDFMIGYGAVQAVPGPLFTFAAYLGALSSVGFSGWSGAIFCLIAIFLPAFLLIIGILPFWDRLRRIQALQSSMQGINAAVVGLLLAAFYNPVWTSAIHNARDFALGSIAFLLLNFWKLPPWLVVILSVTVGIFSEN